MSGAAALHLASEVALALLFVALVLALLRLLRGPTLADRIMALDLMTTLGLSFVAVFALRSGFMLYLDIAIALALAGFLATVAFARYLLSRGRAVGGSPKEERE
jgi:multicomponent Na+:H+ antiporter subunit F